MNSNIQTRKVKLKRPYPLKTEPIYHIGVDTASDEPDKTMIGFYVHESLLGAKSVPSFIEYPKDQVGKWKLYMESEANRYLNKEI